MENKIDIVVPWVDGNDEEWLREKEKYTVSEGEDDRVNRFRDWDNLQYLFRGIDKFLPWIRMVHFITWGHIPKWMDTNCDKLNIVLHKDYIPKEFLPVFSSHPIEMNIHRIKELSDQFIYMNDDMFFLKSMKETDFFQDSLPCDRALESIHQFKKDGIDHIIANDLEILNANFDKKKCIRKNRNKFYTLKYGKGLLKNLYFSPFGNFTGFENPHMPIPYLKEVLEEIWEKEPIVLERTSKNRFRSITDVNQWLIRYWQFASGRFVPLSHTNNQFFSIGKDDVLIEEAIKKQKYNMICLSDDAIEMDFEKERDFIKKCLEEILPQKSRFEK